MKWAFSSIGMIAAGLVGVMIILLFQELTVNNEEEYYLLKEINESAMIDSIDLAYYRDTGKLKIVKEKFVENFTRRFAESASILNTKNYSLVFYDIMEMPPKVSVTVSTTSREYTIYGNHLDSYDYGISNSLDSILEYQPPEIKPKDCFKDLDYISLQYGIGMSTYFGFQHPGAYVIPPEEYDKSREEDWKIASISYVGRVVNVEQVKRYLGLSEGDSSIYRDKKEMFYNPNSEYDIIDVNMWKSFPIYQEFVGDFDVEYSNDHEKPNVVRFKVNYTDCNLGSYETRGFGTKENICVIGVVFSITWQKTTAECLE